MKVECNFRFGRFWETGGSASAPFTEDSRHVVNLFDDIDPFLFKKTLPLYYFHKI